MESHVGNMTGHATVGAANLQAVLYRLPRRAWRRGGRERAVDRSQAAQLHHRHLSLPLHPHGNVADRQRSVRHHRTRDAELQHAALAAADRRGPGEPGRLREAFLAAVGDGEAGHSHRHTAGTAGNRREDQGRPGSLPEAGVLEVSWRDRSRQWTFRRHLDRRREPPDQALQLPRLAALQVRLDRRRRCTRTS